MKGIPFDSTKTRVSLERNFLQPPQFLERALFDDFDRSRENNGTDPSTPNDSLSPNHRQTRLRSETNFSVCPIATAANKKLSLICREETLVTEKKTPR
jgi:hypothetical protein